MSEDIERRGGGQTAIRTRPKVDKPRLYKVVMFNDDYTTQEFVVRAIVEFFHKPVSEATRLMIEVHTKGSAVVGVYPRDIAESKVERVTRAARESGHPLMLQAEPE